MHRFLPSPSASAVHFGLFTVHFYALMILLGIIIAIWLGRARYSGAGGRPDDIADVAVWAIPAGIIGGRLYHVLTSPDKYFGAGGRPLDALKIWEGGMGIWGAIALGTGAAYLAFNSKPRALSFAAFADALAPGLLLAQAIGRWGNWFNIELFGRPTSLPWGLRVPLQFRPVGYENYQTFHPTFLYESLWCALGAVLILAASKNKRKVAPGNIFVFYIAFYCLGRVGFETLRIDQAHHLWGLRINVWVSLVGLCVSCLFLRRPRTIGG